LNKFLKLAGTLFYTGYSPLTPSLIGSLWGIGLFIFLQGGLSQSIALILLFLIGILSARQRILATSHPDPSEIVIDEACGIMLTLIGMEKRLILIASAFFLFHLFDFLKPFPVKKLEKLPGGWGVMLDDLIAGFYARILLEGIRFLIRGVY